MPQDVLPEPLRVSPKSAPKCAVTRAGHHVGVLPGLLDTFLAILHGLRGSFLRAFIGQTTLSPRPLLDVQVPQDVPSALLRLSSKGGLQHFLPAPLPWHPPALTRAAALALAPVLALDPALA